jgi:hypothetical protein
LSHLLITIDVECDKSRTWRTADPVTFSGVLDAIPNRLEPLFKRHGVRPTYLLSPEVIANDDSRDVLDSLQNVELGAHLHGEYIGPPPVALPIAGSMSDAMQIDYPPHVEQAKLAALTTLFIERFGRAPISFRAGRFGVGRQTGPFLVELGYRVESSVTPHICWTNSKGEALPDFRACPEKPYRAGENDDLFVPGQSSLLEVPVTVLAPNSIEGSRPVWPGATAGQPIWFRPWYADEHTLVEVVRHVARANAHEPFPRPLVMMFHNVELVANASPYTRSAADVHRYLDMLAIAFEAALEEKFVPCTLHEYQQWFEESERGHEKQRT